MKRSLNGVLAVLLLGFLPVPAPAGEPAAIDFGRQIRPILSDRCFHCHGPDAKNQKSDLRFDSEENALTDLGGYFAIVPGNLKKSELHRRIHATDPEDRMPPVDSNRSLSAAERALLDEWIRQGAVFGEHWAFVVPESPELPELKKPSWPRNAIDHFILNRLERDGLKPSPEADRPTLLRRASLDLTGLPPIPGEVDAFIGDPDESGGAFERAIDRLLASPNYGERMALPWLDAARYADSAGYQGDFKRSQWPWRDWVIRAYNANMPFDQFSIEQLAGDLLPDPTSDQLLATAFNRNHRINNEGGIIAQEFLVEYVADRVETTATVWLGLTVGCARCHDHKYDPIAQKDFYRLFAFFHNIPEKGKDGVIAPEPNMDVYTSGSRKEHERLEGEAKAANAAPEKYSNNAQGALTAWMKTETGRRKEDTSNISLPAMRAYYSFDARTGNTETNLGTLPAKAAYAGPRRAVTNRKGRHGDGVFLRQGGYLNLGRPWGAGGLEPNQPHSFAAWVKPGTDIAGAEGPLLSCLTDDKAARGFQVNLVEIGEDNYSVAFRLHSNRAKKESIEVLSNQTIPANKFSHLAVTYDGSTSAAGVAIYINGEAVPTDTLLDNFVTPFTTQENVLLGAEVVSSSSKTIRDELLANTDIDEVMIFRSILEPRQVAYLQHATTEDVLFSLSGKPTESAAAFLANRYFEEHDPAYQKLLAAKTKTEAALKAFESKNITQVSIMEEMETPRDTFFLVRGSYDHPDTSEKLLPATPPALLPFDERLPRNRLGLARWLFDESNPLTARVAVNRYWQMHFGTGLVKTPEDFGSQGAPPSHPDLLDWLAVRFRESDWDVKAMQKLILTSATYRQSSVVTPALLRKDPENRLLARAPRFRLNAQALRDQALAASGLLVDKRGGAPVMPYQPEGLWEEVSAKSFKYVVADNEDLYRRSLYTFWRRTVPPPSMMNFDNASREACSVTAARTNTPLQAMNLMNDPTYVEAARSLAERMMVEGGDTLDARLSYGVGLLLARQPDAALLGVLKSGYAAYEERFRENPDAAAEFISVGHSVPDETLDPVSLAAHTAVASVLLNLDETVTKE